VDLAEDLIRLSGLEPGRDIEIEFTGIRSGEKLSEQLWEYDKTYERTDHPDIFRSEHEEAVANGDLDGTLAGLRSLVSEGHARAISSLLQSAIPGAAITEAPTPDITAIV
jgi:FlaA1/EpsC-like NDP-sugar epimerase